MISNIKSPFFFLAFSNLLAAFGGGIILGKGIDCIQTEYLKGGSVLAFFSGTVIGLIFLQSISASLSKWLTRYFSFFSSFISIILLLIFNEYASDQVMIGYSAIIFFALLSIRFSFWFYSRVRRAAEAAKTQHRIAWVELGYYIGIISGLVLWKILNIPLDFSLALIFDALLQFIAGSIDLFTSAADNSVILAESTLNSLPQESSQNNWSWRVVTILTALTVATQAVLFSLAHDVSAMMGTYILAIFYTGVAVAAYLFKMFAIKLEWTKQNGLPFIKCNSLTTKISAYIILLGILIGSCIFVEKDFNSYLQSDLLTTPSVLILALSFSAAFIYELIALSVIDRVNIDYPHQGYSIIIKCYGYMGVGSAVTLWVLNIFDNNDYALFSVLFSCLIMSVITLTKRGDQVELAQI